MATSTTTPMAKYKKLTYTYLRTLNLVQPMSPKIAQLIFNGNGLEKPTQNLFYHLTYYLVFLIDKHIHTSLTWPLCDSKDERSYRNELSGFITDYASKGLLTPVMSSYLVNPACYKITVLLFQLVELAAQRMAASKLTGNKKILFDTVTDKYKNSPESFIEYTDKLNYEEVVSKKLLYHLRKKQRMEHIAGLLRKKITELESKLSNLNANKYINNLIDNFVKHCELDGESKSEILKIKNVNEPAKIFDDILNETDKKLDFMETEWNSKVGSLLKKCQNAFHLTEEINQRHTGQIERSSYTVEFDPKKHEIYTDDLQNKVNSEQKYILKNIHNNCVLSFPNLVRSYLISISFVFKNNHINDEIYSFNNQMDIYGLRYREIITALKALLERVRNAESKLQFEPVAIRIQSQSIEKYLGLPSLPDFSELKIRNNYHVASDTFTPLNPSKHQFNLKRGRGVIKPQPRALVTPFYGPKDDFLKSLMSYKGNADDYNDTSSRNISVISNIRANQTISEGSSGFTREQLTRLLSTNKTKGSKKFKNSNVSITYNDYEDNSLSMISPKTTMNKGIFNELEVMNDTRLLRYSSLPDLFENRGKDTNSNKCSRKLSIMTEDSPTQLEVARMACLDSKYNTPSFKDNVSIIITQPEEAHSSKTETPKVNPGLIKKTSSLEKIINRFKKVRANVVPWNVDDIKTIDEEKENVNVASRNLLPDLLSPGFSSNTSVNVLEDLSFGEDNVGPSRKPRESLGTVLGVDHTFLDQFDLID